MKKIGVITTSINKSGTFGCNYGAALQGYALLRVLRDLGYEAYDFNYISENEYRPQQYNFLRRTLLRLRLLTNTNLIIKKIKEFKYRKGINENYTKFCNFVKINNLTYGQGSFYDIDELHRISRDFYAFITGSDVVWNPYLRKNKNDPGYFLEFVAKNTKRIAYAPSFGVTVLPKESKETLKLYLSKFDAISVRESDGASLIKKETGFDVPVVLDPTLLLGKEEYKDIEIKPKNMPEKYILVYKFGELKHTEDKIHEIQKKTGLPIIYVPAYNNEKNNVRYDFGPSEFLYAIKKAQLVISDSFHCTVFCCLYHTPFLTFYRTMPMSGKDLNSRMINLLDSLNLNNRLVKPSSEIDYSNLFNIDFNNIDFIINKKREDSLHYLLKALGEFDDCNR